MANISGYQESYIKAHEELKKNSINTSALMMSAETSYDEVQNLIQYKDDQQKRAIDYDKKINSYYEHMLYVFLRTNNANNDGVYDTYRALFAKKYLDNTDDDTNDYSDETMIKLNKIYTFIDSNSDKDFTGIELLSAIRKEVTGIEEELEDDYLDVTFEMLKNQSDLIKSVEDIDTKRKLIPQFLSGIAGMEANLFNEKLFYDDYRKSVTGLMNYLLLRAEIPLVYIKPIELEEYYKYIGKVDSEKEESKIDILTFYKEKMCESIKEALVAPMKNSIKVYTEKSVKKYVMEPDNVIDGVRVD